ncbi:hypothetical protein AVEN_232028-1, partial [Araneus ventricosus]
WGGKIQSPIPPKIRRAYEPKWLLVGATRIFEEICVGSGGLCGGVLFVLVEVEVVLVGATRIFEEIRAAVVSSSSGQGRSVSSVQHGYLKRYVSAQVWCPRLVEVKCLPRLCNTDI